MKPITRSRQFEKNFRSRISPNPKLKKRFVPVCPTPWPGVIATGSTKKSFAKFWYAVGALEPDGDSYSQIVLTSKQLTAAKFDWQDVELSGLTGKNFAKIRIIE